MISIYIYMLKNKLTTNAFSSSNNTNNFIELSIKKLINLSFRKDVNALFKYKNQGNLVIDSNNKDDYTLLVEQYVYMKGYLRILDKRIADVVSNIKCLKFNNNKK